MRTVSFVKKLEYDFSGNLFNDALVIGDVDNDQSNELVVGNIDGELAVFKGGTTTGGVPWKYSKNLGMITCISIGDIFNRGKDNIVCLTAEGKCHVFDLDEEAIDPGPSANTSNISTNTDSEKNHSQDPSESEDGSIFIRPSFTQQLSANSRVMLLQDVDGDGLTELVIGYSDRVVCLFRWIEGIVPDCRVEVASALTVGGSIVQLEKWQLAGQVGSITVSHDLDGHIELLVAQPGGSFVKLIRSVEPSDASDASPCDKHLGPSVVYYPLGSALVRSSNVTTVALGGLKTGKIKDGQPVIHCALSTLDGTVILLENEIVEWHMQLEQQFFSLGKLDVMGDGQDEVVTCSWDGQTYIINYNKEVIRFLFDDNVAAFCAGNFAVSPGVNVPTLVYVTFTGKIYVYYDVAMPTIKPVNLISSMESKTETREILEKLNLQNLSPKELREVYQWCLYGMKSM